MNEEQDTFSNLSSIVRRRWWVLVLAILAGTGVGVLVGSHQKTYSASATVLLNQSGLIQELFGPVSAQADPARASQTDLSLATSQAFTSSVAPDLHIAISELNARSSVTAGATSDILSFTGTGPTPLAAATIANTLAIHYVHFRNQIAANDVTNAQRGLQAQLTALNRRTDLSPAQRKALRQTLEQRLGNATALGGVSTSGTEVGSPALPPSSPSSASKTRSAVLGGGIGLLLGLALLLLMAQLDRRLRSLSSTLRAYRLPLLGLVPEHKDFKRGKSFDDLSLVPREAVERIALRMMHALRAKREGAPVVMITSSAPDFGKTLLVRQLSSAIASLGRDVVAVDFDLRRPSLAAQCGCKPSAGGIGPALRSGQIGLAIRALERVPLSDGSTHGFEVCPGGESTEHPGPLLSSPAMTDLLAELRRNRDFVIVDSGPLVATAESLVLLEHVDAVIVVSRLGAEHGAAAEGLIGELNAFDAMTLGVIINRARGNVLPYGYYGATPGKRAAVA